MKRCFQIKAPTTTSTATLPPVTPPTILLVLPTRAAALFGEDGTRDVELDGEGLVGAMTPNDVERDAMFEEVLKGRSGKDLVEVALLRGSERVKEVMDDVEDRERES